MLFFPYAIDLRLHGIPLISTLIGVLCCFIFTVQLYGEKKHEADIENYCRYELTDSGKAALEALGIPDRIQCGRFFYLADYGNDISLALEALKVTTIPDSSEMAVLEKEFYRYKQIVQEPLTMQWWNDPDNPTIWNTISSSLLHGDIEHLVFNLIFFFAFSFAAEQILGSVLYLLFFVLTCITTSMAYDFGFFGTSSGLPSLGISGTVTATMAFVALCYPLHKVKIFYWFFIVSGTIRLPLLIMATAYVSLDIYGFYYLMDKNNINYTSHLAGSITGAVSALIFILTRTIATKKRFKE